MAAFIEALRLTTIVYLLLLAVTAVVDMHQPLLSYPFRVVYSSLRVAVGTVTLGRVELVPAGKRLKRRGVRRLRDLRYEFQEWRAERAERSGKAGSGWAAADSPTPGGWAARSDEQQSPPPAIVDAPVPYVESTPIVDEAPPVSEEQNAFFYDDGVGDDVIGMAQPQSPSPHPKSKIAALWDEDEDDEPLLLPDE